MTTPENGSFTIIGLDADTYFLTEIQQPDGYNKLSAPVKIVIKEDGTITIGDATNTVDKVEVENKSGSILPIHRWNGNNIVLHFRCNPCNWIRSCTDYKEENEIIVARL